MKIHFIAIGGSAMHNLAIALHKQGFLVTGSDDEVFEPSATRLKQCGLLPGKMGWFMDKIHEGLDAVILGMHARADNPELLKAKELGLKIYSYPEYIYECSKEKIRVVIGGSHGKTTITAMIMHVLRTCKKNFDYMVGAQLDGFDTMVKLTKEAPYIILEGDEYLASPIDRRPKFHLYHADIGLVSGIAWDHINVFPTYENYVEQFRIFIEGIPQMGTLIYCTDDKDLNALASSSGTCRKIPYSIPVHTIENGITFLSSSAGKVALQVFGDHNLRNLSGAHLVCMQLGITEEEFYSSIATFSGAARRLELLFSNDHTAAYRDFAHSPSKLQATTEAVMKQYPERKLIACMELHTFSSLNETFLKEYHGSMDAAYEAIVYYSPHTIEHKKLKPISEEQVRECFGRRDLKVFTGSAELLQHLKVVDWKNKNLLLMSSGTFGGMATAEIFG